MPPEPSYLVGGYGEIENEIVNLDNLLCGSIDGWGGESWDVHPNSTREKVKTWLWKK